MRTAVVLLSGGMDSTTLAYQLASEYDDLRLLTIHYGPKIASMSTDANDLDSLAFQTPRVRDEFHDAIIYRTAYLALLAENGATASAWRQEADRTDSEIISMLKSRRKGPFYMNVTSRVLRPAVR